jgi:hypothetical protein
VRTAVDLHVDGLGPEVGSVFKRPDLAVNSEAPAAAPATTI